MRHGTADPGRGAEREVRLVVAHAPGADRGVLQVGHAGDDLRCRPGCRAPRHVGEHRSRRPSPLHAAAAAGSGSTPARRTSLASYSSRSRSRLSVSQAAGHRHVRRGRDPGEPHREVVDRLEVPPRGRRHLGPVAGEVQHVRDRVAAVRAGDAAGPAQPEGERSRRVARRPVRRRSPWSAPRPRASLHIRHSATGRPSASTGTVLAHWPGHGDRDDSAPSTPALDLAATCGGDDRAATTPPRPGWRRSRGRRRVRTTTRRPRRGGDVADLRAAAAQVDGEDEPSAHRLRSTGGRACWVSSIASITSCDEVVGFVGQAEPTGHAAVDRAGLRRRLAAAARCA